jgi:hypothetical protein
VVYPAKIGEKMVVISRLEKKFGREEIKKGKPNIAPLQPPTLATFRSWGSSAGAGRAGLPGGKDSGE